MECMIDVPGEVVVVLLLLVVVAVVRPLIRSRHTESAVGRQSSTAAKTEEEGQRAKQRVQQGR